MAKILVADDDELLRKIIRRFLEKDGHEVVEVSNGHDALLHLRETEIDIVILDVVMPEKGGIETLLEMSCSDITAKVILITGMVDTKMEIFQNLCRQFKAQLVINKPFTREQLAEAVNTLLSRS